MRVTDDAIETNPRVQGNKQCRFGSVDVFERIDSSLWENLDQGLTCRLLEAIEEAYEIEVGGKL